MINVDVEKANLIGIEFSAAEQRILSTHHEEQPIGLLDLDTREYFVDINKGRSQFVDMPTYHRALLNRYGNRVSVADKQTLTELMEQITASELSGFGIKHIELTDGNGLALMCTTGHIGRTSVGWSVVGPSWKEILIKDGVIKPNG